ncbi:exosome complex component RRP42 [Nasonia vitripennis]|uniref:Ribosomal RNA-processing protein 42 n=1 Tax=Nasonia vitripennis TaxID=7425 RepID=A0A7M7QEP9_NASVI|nr:exosome complex component RRP42 [Nasonia vitripennis]XP_031784333.1 exosome complex component RRP42 [Nasonia vitripennis]XP_032455716.1 exosome complex component RRP42 [Nasonia vitripennis]
MAEVPLSLAEKTFILHGVDANFRNDGRSRTDYRCMELETKLMDQVHGSARLRIGNTDILVGVKVEIDTPYPDSPNEGKIEFFVDCSANATPSFEGKGGEDLANEISNVLALAYQSPHAMNLSQLSILPHKKCWKLYVDILILECGGNLFDAVAVAVKAALYSTEIPKVKGAMLDGGEADIVLSDDIYESEKLDTTNCPVLVTLCKIGDNCVVDPSSEEEMCSSANIVVSVMPNGRISSIVKMGYGSLQPATLSKILKMGTSVGIDLNNGILSALKSEDKLGANREIVGFLR